MDSSVELWDLEQKALSAKLTGFSGLAMSLVIDSKSERLFVGTDAGVIQVWNVEAKEMLLSFQAHDSMVVCLSLSPDDAKLLSSAHGGELKLWESNDVGYQNLEQRDMVQKATDLVNRQFANKRTAREIVTQIASDPSIEIPEIVSTAIAIARSVSPVVIQAYAATSTLKKQRQLRSIQEHLEALVSMHVN